MDFLTCGILLLLCVAGILWLCRQKKGKQHQTGYLVGITVLALLAGAAVGYLAATLLFVTAIG